VAGNVMNPVEIRDGGSAELHYDTCHALFASGP
jgi:hypothetical protein